MRSAVKVFVHLGLFDRKLAAASDYIMHDDPNDSFCS